MRLQSLIAYGGMAALALAMISCGASVTKPTAFLPLEDDPPQVHRLLMGEPWPAVIPLAQPTALHNGEAVALRDGALPPTDSLAPGAWLIGDQLIHLRSQEGVAGHAESLWGMPVLLARDGHERAMVARSGRGIDHIGLVILSWRLADEFPWPWVNQVGTFGGLADYMRGLAPDKYGFAYSAEQGSYVDQDGLPIRVGDGSEPGVHLRLGDLIAGGDNDGVLSILVADLGNRGVLDPADVVITAQDRNMLPQQRIERVLLGNVMGPGPIHPYRRDIVRAQERADNKLAPNNPIWHLPAWRQWLALAGMIIIVLTLLRSLRGRRRRRS